MIDQRVYDLDGGAYDLPPESQAPAVHRSYLLCSTPRSGSSLLSEALHATGRLGTPIEYFDPDGSQAVIARRWGCRDLGEYVAQLHRRRTTPDGLFGAKAHWPQLARLAEAYGGGRPALAAVFPSARLVHVTRRDRDRQAVSLAIARQTGRWSLVDGDGEDRAALRYSEEGVAACRADLDDQERGWAALFSELGVTPHVVTYEDLVDRYEDVVRGVARFLDADLDGAPILPPRLRRQADRFSDDWLQRFTRARAAR